MSFSRSKVTIRPSRFKVPIRLKVPLPSLQSQRMKNLGHIPQNKEVSVFSLKFLVWSLIYQGTDAQNKANVENTDDEEDDSNGVGEGHDMEEVCEDDSDDEELALVQDWGE